MPRKLRRLWKSRDFLGRTGPAVRRRKQASAAGVLAAIEILEDRSLLSGTPPVVIASASPLVFNENSGPTAIDNALAVTDADEPFLSSATVTIDGYAASQDILTFTNQNGITGSFNTTTGVLTLSGLSSVANYEAALRSVTFDNVSENPSTKPRSLTIRVNDGTSVGTASRTLVVNSINDTAVASNDSYTLERGNTLNVVAGKISTGSTQFISSVAITGNTGEKPMSKVWKHAGTWWAVFSDDNSTNVWRLDGTVWTSVLDLSARTSVKADVKVVGDVVHVLMQRTSATELRSIQFVPGSSGSPGTYQFWSTQPNLTTLPSMAGLEAVVFEIDTTGKMWVGYENGGQIRVRHSNAPYNSWSAEIVLAANVSSDDIAGIVALPTGQIGVFWSNQTTQHFGFRVHVDGADPSTWLADEDPVGNTAVPVNNGLADDHMSLAVKADGTLYVAVKTSYDTSSQPRLMLLIRRPNGTWDTPYDIDADRTGTRPIVQLSQVDGRLLYLYRNTNGNGPIVYRELTDNGNSVTRGPETILFNGDSVVPAADVNNVSGSKANFSDDLTVIASANGRLTSARLLYRYGVLANDTDVDGDILTTHLVTGPAHGTLTLNANGTFTYTHDGSNTTTDSFTYQAVDASGNSNVATVTFTVNAPTNFPPVGVNNSYSVAEGGTLTASDANGTNPGIADGVLVNDSDPEGQPLTAVLVSNPAHGTITFNANGTFTYVHDGSENFSDSFTYRPHDGNQPGNLTTVSLTITPVNDAPVGVDDSYNVDQWGTLTANDATGTIDGPNDNGVLVNDTDAEGSTFTAVLVTGPTHGMLTLNANGTFTYVHNGDTATSDFFTYRPNDGTANGNLTTVSISIENIQQPVTAHLQDGLNGYAGTTDTYLKDSSVTKNYGNDIELIAHGNPDRSALLRWDVGSIPVASTVQSATITLNVFNETRSVYELYQVLRNWVETGATWNQASTGQNWGIAGAQQIGVDRADTVLGTFTSLANGQATITLNAAGIALVQSWVNNSATNFGFVIQDYANTTTDGVSFDSSEVATVANRPKLSITYLPAPGGGGQALRAAGVPHGAATVTDNQISRMIPEAIRRWTSVLPQSQRADARALLSSLKFQVTDLSGDTVAAIFGNTVFVDINAAGRGWYIDISPEKDSEYIGLRAGHNAVANKRIDLLSAITHEMGHALGIDQHAGSGVMAETLSPGKRVMPTSGEIAALDAIFGSGLGSILG